jgi:phage I-like protein
MSPRLALAVNKAAPLLGADRASLALALQLADNQAPEWVHLIPSGPLIVGRDGRRFTIYDPAAAVAATLAEVGLPLVVDFEHATERTDREGDAPAAGWIEELAVRDGSIWGRVEWTRRAAKAIAEREYRFVSPVFYHERGDDPRVVALVSAGLVHRPNLNLKALNRCEDPPVNLLAQLLAALGLAANTSEADAVTAVRALRTDLDKARNEATAPPLDKYVPTEQHQATVRALNEAQARLDAIDQAATKSKAESLVDEAVKAGKVAPAAKAQYLALALNNFDGTKAAIDVMPAMLKPGEDPAARAAERQAGEGLPGLTDTQKAICRNLGLSEEAYAKSLAARAA